MIIKLNLHLLALNRILSLNSITVVMKFALTSALILVTGCISTGTIEGVSQGKVVEFSYEQQIFENDGKLEMTMPDGEQYSGKFVQDSSSSSGDEWVFGDSSDDDSLVLQDSNTVSSRAQALLIGSRGNTMKCRFQFSDPGAGIDGGGIGTCHTSKKQKVDITF